MEAWFYHRIKSNKDVIMTFYLANMSLYITMLTYEKTARKKGQNCEIDFFLSWHKENYSLANCVMWAQNSEEKVEIVKYKLQIMKSQFF